MQMAEPKPSTFAELERILHTGHWLGNLISDLISAHRLSAGLDFKTAEMLLEYEKEIFEKDLAIARKMYRLYGNLVVPRVPHRVERERQDAA